MKNITKAIIPVAGYGVRRLPVTKAIEKCMLPIGNRPIVDYVVANCVAAGVREIWFVVGEDSTQIREYFGHNKKLENYLEQRGKTEQLEQIQPPENINFHYITQPADGKYGTTIPVALALEKVGTEQPVLVVMGDDFFYRVPGDNTSQLRDLIEVANDGEAAVLGFEVATREEASRYGVIEQGKIGNFVRIVENPAPEDAPSLLINIAKYVCPPKLLKLIVEHADSDQTAANGEYQILKPIDDFVLGGGVMKVVPARGEYLDGGNLAGWFHANEVVAKSLGF